MKQPFVIIDKHWDILTSEYLIKNRWLTVRKDHVKLPTSVEMDDYYVLEYPDWVTVIAITDEGNYIIEKQYRHGIQKISFELCGGTVEKGELPLTAAKRELSEETGYEGGEWSLFMTSAPNPAAMTNVCYTFVVRGVKRTGHQKQEETEDIDVFEIEENELINLMVEGKIIQSDMLSPLWRWMYEKRRKK